MKIFKIAAQPLNTAIQADKPHNSNNINILKACPNDSVNFSGRKLLPKEIEKIDNYILNLKAIKAVRENAAAKVKAAEEVLHSNLNQINQKINPLLNDEQFLWAIEPKESKSKISRFVVDSAYIEGLGYSKQIHDKSWKKVYNSIRSNILTQQPDSIKFEDSRKIELREHKISLLKLKDLLAKKSLLIKEHNKNLRTIDNETFQEIMPFTIKNIDIDIEFMHSTPKERTVEDFRKLIVKRAIEKEPELKKLRDSTYKTFYKDLSQYYHISDGKIKQRASDYANQEVISHIEGTTNTDRPF